MNCHEGGPAQLCVHPLSLPLMMLGAASNVFLFIYFVCLDKYVYIFIVVHLKISIHDC
jgi:hypothetical protein